jgi:hypothetical protein
MCALAQMWARTPSADVAVLLQSLWAQAGPYTDVARSEHIWATQWQSERGAHAFETVVRNRDDREKSILQMTN